MSNTRCGKQKVIESHNSAKKQMVSTHGGMKYKIFSFPLVKAKNGSPHHHRYITLHQDHPKGKSGDSL